MSDRPYTPKLLARLVAVHQALDKAGIGHAVGGAIALAVHTRDPRFTADIDLNVMIDPTDAARLLDALPDDVVIHAEAADELRRDGQTRLRWHDPETPLDLFLPQHPVYHQLVNDRAIVVDIDGVPIPVVAATDLMVFKMLFDRRKDWVDIESILESRAGDADEAAGWIREFLGDDDPRLRRFADIRDEVDLSET